MASPPPFFNDPRAQRRYLRDQARLQRAQMRGMRRTSIVGPIFAIAIGVVFLLVQIGRLPASLVFVWFARWWPLLLVIFGLVRVAEWFLDQRSKDSGAGPTAPRRTLGAGIAFLLGVIVVAGVASSISRNNAEHLLGPAFQFNQDNLDQFFGDKHESTQTLVEACPAGTSVSIDNPHGNVTISGTSDDNMLHTVISNQVFTRSDSEAASKIRQIAAHVERNGDQLSLSVPPVEGGRADLTITLPASVSLTSTVNRGDIQIHSVKGPISVTANHGDIDLSAITGLVTAHINNGDSSLSAHSITGDITVAGRSLDLTLSDITGTVSLEGDFFGTTHLERTSGNVRFHTSRTDLQLHRLDGELEITQNADLTANQVVGPVLLNTRNRNINLERVSGPVTITNRNGSVTLSSAEPLGAVNIENRNGEVDLTLPTDAHFDLRAETSNADLENDFGFSRTEDGDHPKLTGSIGSGGPLVQVSTTQADVAIHKGSLAPLPPSPPAAPRITAIPPEAKQAMRDAQREVKRSEEEIRQAEKHRHQAEDHDSQ